jgi:hypothetical protein
MHPTHEAELDMPMLPAVAKRVHIIPELATHTLLSIGQLCDAGCDVAFTAEEITVKYKGNTVLSGYRTCHTRLWHFSMPSNLPSPKKMSPTEHASMTAIRSATPVQLVAFAHATLFSPALAIYPRISTQQRLLDQFPQINSKNIAQISTTIISYGQRTLGSDTKNQASTKQKPESANTKDGDGDDDVFPTSTSSGEQSHHCYATIMELKGQIYTDQTGCLQDPTYKTLQCWIVP